MSTEVHPFSDMHFQRPLTHIHNMPKWVSYLQLIDEPYEKPPLRNLVTKRGVRISAAVSQGLSPMKATMSIAGSIASARLQRARSRSKFESPAKDEDWPQDAPVVVAQADAAAVVEADGTGSVLSPPMRIQYDCCEDATEASAGPGCLICYDAPRELRLHPCGHAFACIPCTIKLTLMNAGTLRCTHCRTAATAFEILGHAATAAKPALVRRPTFDNINLAEGLSLEEFMANVDEGPRIICGYRLDREVARSGLGHETYHGTHVQTGEKRAIKLEPINTNPGQRTLLYESKVYKILAGGVGILKLHHYEVAEVDNVMVMDMYGKSLDSLYTQCNRHFTLKTILMLADQMLDRIEFMHSRSFTHCNVSPTQFVLGLGRHSSMVHCIGFGLATKYRDPLYGQHIAYQEGRPFMGNAYFSSINALLVSLG